MNVCNEFYIVKKKKTFHRTVSRHTNVSIISGRFPQTLYSHRKQLTILYLKLLIIYNWSIKIYKVVISMNYIVLYSIIYPVNMHWKGLDSQEDVYIYVLIRWNLLSVSVESWNDIQFKWNIRNHLIEKKNCDFNYILLCYSKRRMSFYTSIYLIGPLPSMLYIAVSCYQYHDCHTIVSGIIMK